MRLIYVVGLIALLLSVSSPVGAQSATPAVASPVPDSGDFAGLVDIGGRALYLECRGTGSPTVVLVAGGRSSARYWSDDLLHPDAPRRMVLPGVAESTRVCAYDRPGTYAPIGEEILLSRSDPIAQPRTVPEMVAELHALLQAAGVPGPYVLAGHSLGGYLARLYAATYPDEVVGLVLVDAFSELLESVMPPERWQALVRLNQELGSDEVPPIPGYGDAETTGYGADNAVVREAVAATPLRPMPLGVRRAGSILARGERGAGRPRPERALFRGRRERPRHPPGPAGAGQRSDPAGGGGRAQPGHLVRPDLLLRHVTGPRRPTAGPPRIQKQSSSGVPLACAILWRRRCRNPLWACRGPPSGADVGREVLAGAGGPGGDEGVRLQTMTGPGGVGKTRPTPRAWQTSAPNIAPRSDIANALALLRRYV